MDNMRFAFIIPITLTYAYFSSFAVDKYIGLSSARNICIDKQFGSDERDSCFKNRDVIVKPIEKRNFLYMMVLSMIGIIIGTVVAMRVQYGKELGTGIASGATLTLIFQLFMNWNVMDDTVKLLVLGGVLVGLGYASYKLR